MSYHEKKTIVSILTGILLLTAYSIYSLGKVQSGMADVDDLKFWATTILIFIGIGIVASIIIQIVFHILLSIAIAIKEQVKNGTCDDEEIEKNLELEMVEDEMDKLIELKSMKVGFVIVIIGFVLAMVSLVLNYAPVVMINILFFSLGIGSIIGSVTQIYFYRRGIKNG